MSPGRDCEDDIGIDAAMWFDSARPADVDDDDRCSRRGRAGLLGLSIFAETSSPSSSLSAPLCLRDSPGTGISYISPSTTSSSPSTSSSNREVAEAR